MSLKDQPKLVQDIIFAIDNDRYMWMPIWGEARTGKTTLALLLMFKVYQDWDKVLGAVIFDLNGLLYKMQKGEPALFPTVVKPVHMRVPILLWDDFAAKSGKAQTQHERAWDVFKGAFDTLGTRISVLLATMVNPRSPTEQLLQKYTHEILIHIREDGKRVYKYDKCRMQQDFVGWRSRQRKRWLESQVFGKVPLDVFKQYDEMRTSLVDEVFVSMQDAMAEDTIDRLMKRVQPIDYELLFLIEQSGMVNYRGIMKSLGNSGKQSLTRCKARGLVTPVRRSQSYYVYDITDLGLDLLKSKQVQDGKQAQASQKSKYNID
ncbi:hypothetical protein KAU88_07930 [Candidatus Bathyarchaeota archaeon]|nr:hypothetical protein [Candidatus Bathyarchaeota archaeon]